MEYFSFTVVDGRGASYFKDLETNYTGSSITAETRNSSNAAWGAATLLTASAESTGVRITVSAANATSAVGGLYYRVLSDATPIVEGRVYLFQRPADAPSGGGSGVANITLDGETISSLDIVSSVAPLNGFVDLHGFKACNLDPISAGSNGSLSNGIIMLCKLLVIEPNQINNVIVNVNVAGATFTANANYVGLYDSSGTLLRQSADLATTFNTTGQKVIPLTTPAFVEPGVYYVGILGNSTTSTQLGRGNANSSTLLINSGLDATKGFRWGQIGSGLTALPTQLTMTNMTAKELSYWVALT